MSRPPILDNMASGWGQDATQTVAGQATGAAAALWDVSRDGQYEVSAEPDPHMHVLAVVLNRAAADMFIDGQRVFSGHAGPSRFQIVQAGRHPRAVVRGPLRCLHLYLPVAVLDDIISTETTLASRAVELIDPCYQHDPAISWIGSELAAEMHRPQPFSRLRVDGLMRELGVQVLRRHSNLGGTNAAIGTRSKGGLAPWQAKRVCEAMDAALETDVSLDGLAAVAGCSPTHFSRAFKQSMGVPPFTWLLNRRIERAQRLLQGTNLPLAEIALAVGFAAQPQFTTAFRRVAGVTPGAWRRDHAT